MRRFRAEREEELVAEQSPLLPSLHEGDHKGEKPELSFSTSGGGLAFTDMTDHRACDAHVTTRRGAGVWMLLSRMANVVNWRNLALRTTSRT